MSVYQQIMDALYDRNPWTSFLPDTVDLDVQGWNGSHSSLERLPHKHQSQIIVDVGVWKGQSTITMANNLRAKNIDGVVIAVDTYLGSAEHWDRDRDLFNRCYGMPDLYRTFMSNVAAHKLQDYILPMPQTSTTACMILKARGIRPTLVHVDAAHEYREALQDIRDYWDILADGGVLIGDDYHETWPGVVRAVGEFSAFIGRPLEIAPPKFILTKP